MSTKIVPKKADSLDYLDKLADGAIVIGTSHQLDWFYVRALRSDGHFVRRRYRHAQMVKILDETGWSE